jgi:hypothetical protein
LHGEEAKRRKRGKKRGKKMEDKNKETRQKLSSAWSKNG